MTRLRRALDWRLASLVARMRVGRAAKARRLVRAGLIDAKWYAVQAGQRFPTPISAALHYIQQGRFEGLSPNPLFEPAWFRRNPGRPNDLLDYLAGTRVPRGTHPLFSEAHYLLRHPEAGAHPGRSLGHFLSTASADTPLRRAFGRRAQKTVKWGAARASLIAAAREFRRHQRLAGERTSRTWDVARERVAIRRWESAPLPNGEGPLVSVVMPVRNRPLQVANAIQSIRRQTLTNWELLVVDDGSDDATPDIVCELANHDDRIRLIQIEHSGVSAARNAGLKEVRGQYVAFLDSDNQWTRHHLRVGVAMLHGRNKRACHTVVERRQSGQPSRFHAFEGDRRHLLVSNHIDLNALVVASDLLTQIGGFNVALRRWVDYDLVIRLSEHTEIPLVPIVGVIYDEDTELRDRISVVEGAGWEHVVLASHLVDWTASEQRVAKRVSFLMTTSGDWASAARTINRVLDAADQEDAEVVVVDTGSDRASWILLNAAVPLQRRVRCLYYPRSLHPGLALNIAAASSTGETLVFLNPGVEPEPGWLRPLLAQLAEPNVVAAQPLIVRDDSTIATGGWAFPGGEALPTQFLAGHPIGDAEGKTPVTMPGLSGTALACDASDFEAVGGFDAYYGTAWHDVDLCLRLRERSGRELVLVPQSVVRRSRLRVGPKGAVRSAARHDEAGRTDAVEVHRVAADDAARFRSKHAGRLPSASAADWQAFGFAVQAWRPSSGPDAASRSPEPILMRSQRAGVSSAPSLRWAIKTCSPAGPGGERWGDTHFARSLAAALRRRGQNVVIDPRQAHQRSTSYLDDVVLHLRGLERFVVQPGRVNLMWVISHPDLVSTDEVRAYDAVFAASAGWASSMSARAGVRIEPLLQATDARLMSHGSGAPDSGPPVLFVGNSRGTFRPIIRDAVRIDLPVTIYGSGWGPFVDPGLVRAPYLPNDELPSAYACAGVVLNDHWEDMAEEGFISNRIFDAAAAGARVVSDEIEGVDELFRGAVQTYTSPRHLGLLCGKERDTTFPSYEDRLAIADYVRRDHSFDARAQQLLSVAAQLVGRWSK